MVVLTSGRIRVSYLVAFSNIDEADEWIGQSEGLSPRKLLSTGGVVIVSVDSVNVYDGEASNRHSVIDHDLDVLRVQYPQIGSSHPELNGRAVGNRWPVVFLRDGSNLQTVETVVTEASWDNLLVVNAPDNIEESVLYLAAMTFARYRLLGWGLDRIRQTLVQIDDLSNQEKRIDKKILELENLRRQILTSKIESDPRSRVYWGCENLLLQKLYKAWSLDSLEDAANEALESADTVLVDLRNRAAARSLSQAGVTLVFLSVVSGLSGATSLITFAGSRSRLSWEWMPRGLISVSLALVAVLLVFLLRSKVRQGGDSSL